MTRRANVATQIFDLAEQVGSVDPGLYLLGLSIGWLQAQGRSLQEIQSIVETTFNTSWEEARACAALLDGKAPRS